MEKAQKQVKDFMEAQGLSFSLPLSAGLPGILILRHSRMQV